MTAPRFLRAGEHGVLAEFDSLAEAIACRAALDRAPIDGVTDASSGARTVLLRFDPLVTERGAVERALGALVLGALRFGALRFGALGPGASAASPGDAPGTDARGGTRLVELPVVYDGDDLASLAALLGMTPGELIAVHTARVWTCAFCGFAPGFGYLVSDGPSLGVPRRATPRTRVPVGAVGLAGEFSGVYPRESPGGWQLIGRTDAPLWSLDRTPPALVPVGTRVRFVDAGRG